jgi:hypothetical protein
MWKSSSTYVRHVAPESAIGATGLIHGLLAIESAGYDFDGELAAVFVSGSQEHLLFRFGGLQQAWDLAWARSAEVVQADAELLGEVCGGDAAVMEVVSILLGEALSQGGSSVV